VPGTLADMGQNAPGPSAEVAHENEEGDAGELELHQAMTAQTVAQRQRAYKAAQREAGLVRLEAYVTREQREKFRAIGGDEWLRKAINRAHPSQASHLTGGGPSKP
jgi:hypothetical protein